MAQFLNDTFTGTTGTSILSHTGETGATWTRPTAYNTGTAILTNANRLRGSTTSVLSAFYSSGLGAAAAYTVRGALYVASLVGDDIVGINGRQATNADTMYRAQYNVATAAWELYSRSAGTAVLLGSYAQTLNVGQTYVVALEMVSTAIKLAVDGEVKVSVTNSTVSATNRAGVFFGSSATAWSDTTHLQLDYVTATDQETFAVTVASNDANLSWSPANWFVNGATYAQSNNAGAYLKMGFSGTGVQLTVDVTPLTGAPASAAADYPTIRWSIDGGPSTTRQLLSTDTAITLSTTLTPGNHTLLLLVVATTGTAAASLVNDHWTTPKAVVRITNVKLVTGAASVAGNTVLAGFIKTRKAIIFGDSIVAGWKANNGNHDAELAFAFQLGQGLGVEFGCVGFPSQGWTIAGQANVPAFQTAYSSQHNGQARSFTGIDLVVVVHGTNDALAGTPATDAAVTTAVTNWASAMRTTLPNAELYLVIPFGRFKASAIAAATRPDANCRLVDVGTEIAIGLSTNDGIPTRRASDGIHPNIVGTAEICSWLAADIQRYEPGPWRPVGLAGGVTI